MVKQLILGVILSLLVVGTAVFAIDVADVPAAVWSVNITHYQISPYLPDWGPFSTYYAQLGDVILQALYSTSQTCIPNGGLWPVYTYVDAFGRRQSYYVLCDVVQLAFAGYVPPTTTPPTSPVTPPTSPTPAMNVSLIEESRAPQVLDVMKVMCVDTWMEALSDSHSASLWLHDLETGASSVLVEGMPIFSEGSTIFVSTILDADLTISEGMELQVWSNHTDWGSRELIVTFTLDGPVSRNYQGNYTAIRSGCSEVEN